MPDFGMVHYYEFSGGSMDDEATRRMVNRDLERGAAVKLHTHKYVDQAIISNMACSCPVRYPDEPEQADQGTGSSSDDPGSSESA